MINKELFKSAITFGRYNIITNGHISTINEILQYWESVHILVIDKDIPCSQNPVDGLTKFYELCELNHVCEKNRFSILERLTMLDIVLTENNLKERVYVEIIARPELDYNNFNKKFPKEYYDVVFPASPREENEFDIVRNEAFEKILKRKIYSVNPRQIIHRSQIASKINENADIKHYFPDSIYSYLNLINGFSRLK